MLKSALLTSRRLPNIQPTTSTITRQIALPIPALVSQKSVVYTQVVCSKEAKLKKDRNVHLQNLLSSKKAFEECRRVLHTGLYSQIVAMEVPVGGEIGDEVRVSNALYECWREVGLNYCKKKVRHMEG
ncbi:hypothetical protein K505DRAFT_17183 [Melanomma pulvis-pyrius CBS 109.77]|uniref:Uncharacterized protein n=1 Tax=Melanomma pulvis-pyrius CBS 109.77 TaxID=1314802 RepID=A0A6A6XFW1_9PLEO|nr:hypothetical protein K505DRAFT_17183 [Melanomma pulvis-pyrius CBS 109.77]